MHSVFVLFLFFSFQRPPLQFASVPLPQADFPAAQLSDRLVLLISLIWDSLSSATQCSILFAAPGLSRLIRMSPVNQLFDRILCAGARVGGTEIGALSPCSFTTSLWFHAPVLPDLLTSRSAILGTQTNSTLIGTVQVHAFPGYPAVIVRAVFYTLDPPFSPVLEYRFFQEWLGSAPNFASQCPILDGTGLPLVSYFWLGEEHFVLSLNSGLICASLFRPHVYITRPSLLVREIKGVYRLASALGIVEDFLIVPCFVSTGLIAAVFRLAGLPRGCSGWLIGIFPVEFFAIRAYCAKDLDMDVISTSICGEYVVFLLCFSEDIFLYHRVSGSFRRLPTPSLDRHGPARHLWLSSVEERLFALAPTLIRPGSPVPRLRAFSIPRDSVSRARESPRSCPLPLRQDSLIMCPSPRGCYFVWFVEGSRKSWFSGSVTFYENNEIFPQVLSFPHVLCEPAAGVSVILIRDRFLAFGRGGRYNILGDVFDPSWVPPFLADRVQQPSFSPDVLETTDKIHGHFNPAPYNISFWLSPGLKRDSREFIAYASDSKIQLPLGYHLLDLPSLARAGLLFSQSFDSPGGRISAMLYRV